MKRIQDARQKRSVLIGWAFSYFIILLIPMITIVANYFYYVYVIREGICYANELVLDNLSASVDSYLEKQISFYSYVYSDDDLYSIMSNAKKNNYFYSDVAAVKVKLNAYGDNMANMSCLLYLPEKDYVIYNDGASDSEKIYNTYRFCFDDMISYEEWMNILGAEYKNKFFVERFLHHKSDSPSLVYATSITHSAHKPMNIFISIPSAEIEELVALLSPGSKFVLCIDGEVGMAASCTGMEEISDDILNACNEREGSLFKTQNYMVIKKASFRKEISYYLLIPQEALHVQLKYVRYVFVWSIILTLLTGAICAAFLVKWNFRPISNLMQKIIGTPNWNGNEYKWIEKAYFGIVKEKDEIQKQILNMKKDIDCNNLLAIMKGRSTEKGENIISVEPGQKLYLVGFMLPFNDDKQMILDELVFFTVENIFIELMADYTYYKIEDGQYLSFLFLVDEKEAEWRNTCVERAEFVCEFLHEKWNIKMMAVVFEETDEIGKLRYLYRQMVTLFEGGKLQDKIGVVNYQLKRNSDDAKSRLVESMKDYIREHYREPELNVNIIADALGKNPRYISKIFKEEMKEGMPEYINRMRIKNAMTLMQAGELKIDEIINMSGYVSMATFRRSFIKIIGMTPGKYMEDWKNEILNK